MKIGVLALQGDFQEHISALTGLGAETAEVRLPEQLDEAEIDQLISAAIEATGASSMKDMGKVMGQLKDKLQGRADMGAVSGKIKAKLSG